MNWDAVGALAEIIGAGAVVVSLIYLAAQIRTQNAESRIAGNHAILEGFRNSIADLADPNFAELSHRCLEDVGSLSGQELMQVFAAYQRTLRVWEEAYLLHLDGRLDEELWTGMERQYTSLLAHAGIRHVWELRKDYYSKKFREYVIQLPKSEYRLRADSA